MPVTSIVCCCSMMFSSTLLATISNPSISLTLISSNHFSKTGVPFICKRFMFCLDKGSFSNPAMNTPSRPSSWTSWFQSFPKEIIDKSSWEISLSSFQSRCSDSTYKVFMGQCCTRLFQGCLSEIMLRLYESKSRKFLRSSIVLNWVIIWLSSSSFSLMLVSSWVILDSYSSVICFISSWLFWLKKVRLSAAVALFSLSHISIILSLIVLLSITTVSSFFSTTFFSRKTGSAFLTISVSIFIFLLSLVGFGMSTFSVSIFIFLLSFLAVGILTFSVSILIFFLSFWTVGTSTFSDSILIFLLSFEAVGTVTFSDSILIFFLSFWTVGTSTFSDSIFNFLLSFEAVGTVTFSDSTLIFLLSFEAVGTSTFSDSIFNFLLSFEAVGTSTFSDSIFNFLLSLEAVGTVTFSD